MVNDLAHIFRSYDVRGIYKKDLDENIMQGIGNILGQVSGEDVVVGMDMRTSSNQLREALINGIMSTRNVHDLGLVPIGVALFYAWKNKLTLAYITASHLAKEWNGVKFFHSDGMGYLEDENFKIRDMFLSKTFVKGGKAKVTTIDTKKVTDEYMKHLSKIKANKKLRIVLDCGNGMGSIIAQRLFEKAGYEVFTIFDDLDGTFPNRGSEPTDKVVTALKKEVKKKKADLGIAYDGDADRMLIVDDTARAVVPEQVAYLVLPEIMENEEGPIIANVECTRLIDDIAKQFDRKVIRVKVGHPYLVKGAQDHNAIFGIETSGHFVLPSIFPFDDSLAVSFFAAHVLSGKEEKLASIVDDIPKYYFERINFDCDDDKKFAVIEGLKEELKDHELNTLDGIRIDFSDGWVLIRASNTGPKIRLTVEGATREGFEELKEKFIDILKSALTAT